jgi:co-chaperonin GroES (HSP10)
MSQNTSGLAPLGRAVLVEPYEAATKSDTIVILESTKERQASLETRALVIEVGPACWPDEPARAKAGDRVLLANMAGVAATGPKDGRRYRFVNDRDIFAAITEEA